MGTLRRELAIWLLEIFAIESYNCRCHGHIVFPVGRPYEQNQHQIIIELFKHDYDFWISIDEDNPPVKNIIDLIFLNKDMIGCPTPVWHYVKGKAERPVMWNTYDYVSKEDGYTEHVSKNGLQEMDAVGTGCFVIHQRCFDHDLTRQGAFTRELDSQGLVYKGNDISFCEKLKKAGFHIFAHYDYPCRHYNTINLLDTISAFGEIVVKLNA